MNIHVWAIYNGGTTMRAHLGFGVPPILRLPPVHIINSTAARFITPQVDGVVRKAPLSARVANRSAAEGGAPLYTPSAISPRRTSLQEKKNRHFLTFSRRSETGKRREPRSQGREKKSTRIPATMTRSLLSRLHPWPRNQK